MNGESFPSTNRFPEIKDFGVKGDRGYLSTNRHTINFSRNESGLHYDFERGSADDMSPETLRQYIDFMTEKMDSNSPDQNLH